jgi:alkylated DNA repair dioxygenase AlkB
LAASVGGLLARLPNVGRASACKLRFRRKAGNKWERFTLNAQPRSLYVMTGASRHVWEHSIPPVRPRAIRSLSRTMAQA